MNRIIGILLAFIGFSGVVFGNPPAQPSPSPVGNDCVRRITTQVARYFWKLQSRRVDYRERNNLVFADIPFPQLTTVYGWTMRGKTGRISQTREDGRGIITEYMVQLLNSDGNWIFINNSRTGKEIFVNLGNLAIPDTITSVTLANPVKTLVLRVIPELWDGVPYMLMSVQHCGDPVEGVQRPILPVQLTHSSIKKNLEDQMRKKISPLGQGAGQMINQPTAQHHTVQKGHGKKKAGKYKSSGDRQRVHHRKPKGRKSNQRKKAKTKQHLSQYHHPQHVAQPKHRRHTRTLSGRGLEARQRREQKTAQRKKCRRNASRKKCKKNRGKDKRKPRKRKNQTKKRQRRPTNKATKQKRPTNKARKLKKPSNKGKTTLKKPRTETKKKKPPNKGKTTLKKPRTRTKKKKPPNKGKTTLKKPRTETKKKKPPNKGKTALKKPRTETKKKKPPNKGKTTLKKPRTETKKKKPPNKGKTALKKPRTETKKKKPPNKGKTTLKKTRNKNMRPTKKSKNETRKVKTPKNKKPSNKSKKTSNKTRTGTKKKKPQNTTQNSQKPTNENKKDLKKSAQKTNKKATKPTKSTNKSNTAVKKTKKLKKPTNKTKKKSDERKKQNSKHQPPAKEKGNRRPGPKNVNPKLKSQNAKVQGSKLQKFPPAGEVQVTKPYDPKAAPPQNGTTVTEVIAPGKPGTSPKLTEMQNLVKENQEFTKSTYESCRFRPVWRYNKALFRPDDSFLAMGDTKQAWRAMYGLGIQPYRFQIPERFQKSRNQKYYLEIDFKKITSVFALKVAGSSSQLQWGAVTRFSLFHKRRDSQPWQGYVDHLNQPRVFEVGTREKANAHAPSVFKLDIPITAKALRIYPERWASTPLLMIDLITCETSYKH